MRVQLYSVCGLCVVCVSVCGVCVAYVSVLGVCGCVFVCMHECFVHVYMYLCVL